MAGREQLLPCTAMLPWASCNLSMMEKVWLEPFTSSEAILFSCGHQPLLRPQTVPCVVQCDALQHSHALAQPVLMPLSSLSPSASEEQSCKEKQLHSSLAGCPGEQLWGGRSLSCASREPHCTLTVQAFLSHAPQPDVEGPCSPNCFARESQAASCWVCSVWWSD